MERSTSDLEATMSTSQQLHFTRHRDNFENKNKIILFKVNDYMDTVGWPKSDGEGTLPTFRPTTIPNLGVCFLVGPRQANLVLIAYASSEGSGEPAHPRSLARTFAARSYKQWVKRNLQTESQIPGPSEWLGMRSWKFVMTECSKTQIRLTGPS